MIADYFKKINWIHVLVMVVGNIFIGMGVSLFKLSGLGNDPFNGMVMALADCTGIAYANFIIITNIVLFIIEILFGRKFIGLGTIVNAFLLGYIVTFFNFVFNSTIGAPDGIISRLIIMLIGVVIISFGLSLYQMPDEGVAPYDSISLIMIEKQKKVPYFWCRMSNDAICAFICFLGGGIVGIGTLVSAFCLGPVVSFFNKHFTEKLLNKVDSKDGE